MTIINIDERAKAIRNIADMLLHLTYIEYTLQDKFLKRIGDPAETMHEIDVNYNQRTELIEDYVNLINHPLNTEIINKYLNQQTNYE